MKIGVGLAQSTWPDGKELSPADIVEQGVRAEELGFDSLWAGDHHFLELGPARRIERAEPFVLLSYLAARTQRVELGTMVACARFRPVGQIARESKTLADFSAGRFILGLGAGWHQPEFAAFDIEGDHLSSRLREYVEALTALFAGGRVDYDGRYVKLRGAEVGGESAPPIMVGAVGPKGIDMLARHAQGWNFGGPTEDFPALLGQVREREVAAGREPGSVMASAAVCALLGPEDEARRALARLPVAVGTDALRTVVERYRAAGCDHLILHLSGMPFSGYGGGRLELAAEALGLGA